MNLNYTDTMHDRRGDPLPRGFEKVANVSY